MAEDDGKPARRWVEREYDGTGRECEVRSGWEMVGEEVEEAVVFRAIQSVE